MSYGDARSRSIELDAALDETLAGRTMSSGARASALVSAVVASSTWRVQTPAGQIAATGCRITLRQITVRLPPASISFFHESRRWVGDFWIVFHTILSGA
jgi:hypothetical protein